MNLVPESKHLASMLTFLPITLNKMVSGTRSALCSEYGHREKKQRIEMVGGNNKDLLLVLKQASSTGERPSSSRMVLIACEIQGL